MKHLCWILVVALLIHGQAIAQEAPSRITPDNAAQLTQLAMIGRGQISDLAWSPDSRALAVATTIGIWLYPDLESDPVLLASQSGPLTGVAFSSDGTQLAAASLTSDHMAAIQLWDAAAQQMIGTWSQDNAWVGTLAFVPQGELRAAIKDFTTNNVTILQFSADQPLVATPVTVITDPKIETREFAFSADTSRLVICGGTITGSHQTASEEHYYTRIWDTATGEEVSVLHTVRFIPHVAINASASLVATVTETNQLEVWDTRTQSVIATLPVGSGPMRFSGPWLAYATQSNHSDSTGRFYDDTQLTLYNLETNVTQPLTPVLTEIVFNAFAFSPDGSTLAAASSDRVNGQIVRLFDLPTGIERTALSFGAGSPDTMSLPAQLDGTWFTPDGSRFIAYRLSSLQVWDSAFGTILFRARISGYNAPRAVSPNSRWLAVASTLTTVSIWDLDTGQMVMTLPDYGGQISSLVFSPDSAQLVLTSQSPDWATHIWNTTDWTQQTVIESSGIPVFAPQSTLLALVQGDQVQLWDLSTTTFVGEYDSEFAQESSAVLFSPDGTLMLYGRGRYHTMVDTQTGVVLYEIDGRWLETFSPDGSLVAIQGLYDEEGSRVVLTDTAARQEYASLVVPDADYFVRIAFSPDGKLILATEFYGQTTIWDVATKTQVAQLPYAVVFNPDVTLVAGASPDGTIHVWDTTTWTELTALQGHTYRPSGLQFSPDGTQLLSSNDDGTLRLWGIPAD